MMNRHDSLVIRLSHDDFDIQGISMFFVFNPFYLLQVTTTLCTSQLHLDTCQ